MTDQQRQAKSDALEQSMLDFVAAAKAWPSSTAHQRC